MLSHKPEPKNLLELNHLHLELEGLFHEHQLALLEGTPGQARVYLRAYESALLHHLREEEEILLPLYRNRATIQRGGDPETFLGEHRKIVEWLGRLQFRLSRLAERPLENKSLISLIDDEAHFKKYLEHHSLREDNIFYPEIERITTPEEKSGLMRLLTFSLEENMS